MKKKGLAVVVSLAAALILSGAPIHADDTASVNREKIEALETAYRKAELGSRMIGKKRLHHQNRMKRIDDVLNRLQADQDVDPSELDRMLQ